jgi:hypothetical protein
MEKPVRLPLRTNNLCEACHEKSVQKNRNPEVISYLEAREDLGGDAKCYLRTRINPQIKWLNASREKYKKGFMRYRVIALALSILTTILPSYMNYKDSENPQISVLAGWIPFVVQLASASATLSLALLSLNRSQENSVRYRSSAEALEREKLLFLTRTTEPYASDQAFQNFVLQAEAIMQEERSQWTRQIQESNIIAKPDNEISSDAITAATTPDSFDLMPGAQGVAAAFPSASMPMPPAAPPSPDKPATTEPALAVARSAADGSAVDLCNSVG